MIIQSICLLDQLDKDINTFAMRVREWYCWHFPELKDLVRDNYVFAKCAALIGDRTSLDEAKQAQLVEKVGNDELLAADRQGVAAQHGHGLLARRHGQHHGLHRAHGQARRVPRAAPPLPRRQDGDGRAEPEHAHRRDGPPRARLQGGLAHEPRQVPASTVQILGAREGALPRAQEEGQHAQVRAHLPLLVHRPRGREEQGPHLARRVANKCAIASRIDSFADEPTRKYGEKMRDQVEERLRFYDTGEQPRKNLDVMTEVANELRAAARELRRRRRAREEGEEGQAARRRCGRAAPALFAPAAAAPAADGKKKTARAEAEAAAAPAVAAAELMTTATPRRSSPSSRRSSRRRPRRARTTRLTAPGPRSTSSSASSPSPTRAAASRAEPPKKKKKDKKA